MKIKFNKEIFTSKKSQTDTGTQSAPTQRSLETRSPRVKQLERELTIGLQLVPVLEWREL